MSISVDVHLLSGKSASLDVVEDASVESLKQRAQSPAWPRVEGGCTSGEVLDRAKTIIEAKVKSGDQLTLHMNQFQHQATKPGCLMSAFAAILGDGSVVPWGDVFFGDDSSAVQDQLKKVQQIQASEQGICCNPGEGSVVAWGTELCGGDSSLVQDQLQDVQQIQASSAAIKICCNPG